MNLWYVYYRKNKLNIGILDSENITTLSASMLSGLCRIYILIPSNQKQLKLTLPCINNHIVVKFITCSGSGKNNMDYHIMALTGYFAKKVESIRIISNDSDFKNIVNFWRSKNIVIEQYGNKSINGIGSVLID